MHPLILALSSRKMETRLGYIAKPYLKKKRYLNINSQTCKNMWKGALYHVVNSESTRFGAREWLKALAKDLGLVPTWQQQPSSTPVPGEASALFWLLWAPEMPVGHMHTCIKIITYIK